MRCEVCGKETDKLFEVSMEGSVVETCGECKNLGTEPSKPGGSSGTASSSGTGGSRGSTRGKSSGKRGGGSRRSGFSDMEQLVDDYPSKIRQAREGMGMTQQELSDRVGEKRSLIRKLEKGDKLPSDDVVSKLERTLDINLKEKVGDLDIDLDSGDDDLAFGDVVHIKKK